MLLVFDIGNTSTSFAFYQDATIVQQGHVLHAEGFEKVLEFKQGVEKIAFASVNSKATENLQRFLKQNFTCEFVEITSCSSLNFKVAVPAPETVGVDRLLNAAAAVEHYVSPFVTIDIGTALVVDYINADSEFIAGAIMPGPQMALNALAQQTDALPEIKFLKSKALIADNTTQAMLAGVSATCRMQVEGYLKHLTAEYGVKTILLTGGFSHCLIEDLSEKVIHRPDLTLEGLRILSKLQ